MAARPHISSWLVLPAVAVIGVGIGLLFTTMTTVAVGNISPELSGSASGVFNTIRQLGQALGTAAVGALLQGTLRQELHDEAVRRSIDVPMAYRNAFIKSFADVGGGNPFMSAPKAAEAPGAVGARLHQLGTEVFNQGFVSAMRGTLLLPIGLCLVAAVCCLGITSRRRVQRVSEQPEPVRAFDPS